MLNYACLMKYFILIYIRYFMLLFNLFFIYQGQNIQIAIYKLQTRRQR